MNALYFRAASAASMPEKFMFMFVLIGNSLTMAILGKALWPEGGRERLEEPQG